MPETLKKDPAGRLRPRLQELAAAYREEDEVRHPENVRGMELEWAWLAGADKAMILAAPALQHLQTMMELMEGERVGLKAVLDVCERKRDMYLRQRDALAAEVEGQKAIVREYAQADPDYDKSHEGRADTAEAERDVLEAWKAGAEKSWQHGTEIALGLSARNERLFDQVVARTAERDALTAERDALQGWKDAKLKRERERSS